jgi:hypothetical protein
MARKLAETAYRARSVSADASEDLLRQIELGMIIAALSASLCRQLRS